MRSPSLPPPGAELARAAEGDPLCAYPARVPLLRSLAVQMAAAMLVLALAALAPAATGGDANAMS